MLVAHLAELGELLVKGAGGGVLGLELLQDGVAVLLPDVGVARPALHVACQALGLPRQVLVDANSCRHDLHRRGMQAATAVVVGASCHARHVPVQLAVQCTSRVHKLARVVKG